jgi:hypothetical protein
MVAKRSGSKRAKISRSAGITVAFMHASFRSCDHVVQPMVLGPTGGSGGCDDCCSGGCGGSVGG